MAGRGVKAGKAYVELFADDNKLVRGLRRAQRKIKAFGASVQQAGRSMAMLSAAIAAPLVASVKVFTSMGDTLDKMAKRTGVSVEVLSELKFVASQTGAEFAGLENAFRRMQRSIYDASRGLSTQVDALKDLGLEYNDLAGLSPERQFKLMGEKISALEDPTRRAAIAMALMGRSGTSLLPMFENGAKGIEELQQKARDLGLTISTEAAEAAAELNDRMTALWDVVKRAAFEIGSSLVPVIEKFVAWATEAIQKARAWIERNRELITGIAKFTAILGVAGVALVVIGKAISTFSALMGVAVVASKALIVALTFLAAHPVVAALIGIGVAVGGIIYIVRRLISTENELDDQRAEAHRRHMRRLQREREAYKKTLRDREIARQQMIIDAEERLEELNKAPTKPVSPAERAIADRMQAKHDALNRMRFAELTRPGGARKEELTAIEARGVTAREEARVARLQIRNNHAAERAAAMTARHSRAAGTDAEKWLAAKNRVVALERKSAEFWGRKARKKMTLAEYVQESTEGKMMVRWAADASAQVAGQFGGRGAAMLGHTGPAEQTAKACIEIVSNTKKIVANTAGKAQFK